LLFTILQDANDWNNKMVKTVLFALAARSKQHRLRFDLSNQPRHFRM
jgi:hypothetical protein